MPINTALKVKIVGSGKSQEEIAKVIDGLFASTLSKIVNGWQEPTQEQKAKIAEELGCEVGDIF